jgi:diguanylate cyclase (GGDEF)-like protein/PAS domain S-box-containing protein
LIPDIQPYLKASKFNGRAPSVLCGLVGLTSLYWAVRSAQPLPVILFFGAALLLAPVLYVMGTRSAGKLAEEQEDAAVYRELINQVNDAILVMSVSDPYRILEGNRAACSWLGYEREELVTLNASDIADIRSTEELLRRRRPSKTAQADYREINYRTRDNKTVPVEVNVRFIRLRGQRALLAVGRDLSERKRMENRIRHMAYYDDLTGLPNRRLLRDRLETAMEETREGQGGVAVLYLDIDRFKLVNDSFGHDYGDILLMQVAERFTRCVSDEDFLARTEGDEFALFYTNVNTKEQLDLLAEGIGEALEQPFVIGEYQIHITASIGISHFMGDAGETADLMMKYADIALSRSKDTGKNNHQIFNADMNTISLTRLTMESELRRAILKNEFVLVYQPQINIENSALVGMEALIRWKHPERGMVPPKDFIPIAEDTGLIVPIGEWVLTEACKQNKKWQDAGYPAVPVSVNLSMRQFLQHNLKGKIESILECTGLQARYLELEITESMTMDVDFATNSLLELKSLGVRISIDDFGTGYSSLHLLKRFPIDKLKIDRSFVRDIMLDPNDAAIVTTIISMTHHLNLLVIAEGVETEEQMRFLHENRCNQIQGYWFSPPVPPGRMQEMMEMGSSYFAHAQMYASLKEAGAAKA